MQGPRATKIDKASWVKGVASWTHDRTFFISVAFTWRLREACELAANAVAQGYAVQIGGPLRYAPNGYASSVLLRLIPLPAQLFSIPLVERAPPALSLKISTDTQS